MTDHDYQQAADALLRRIEAQADAWLQADVIDIDTQRTGGLLELTFPNRSKVVVNTQPPLQEIWLASRAGGFHFQHREGRWLDTKTGTDFETVFNEQLSAQAGRAMTLSV